MENTIQETKTEPHPEAVPYKSDSGFIHTNEKTKQLVIGLSGLLIGIILGLMMRAR
jgi:hypothetical protein